MSETNPYRPETPSIGTLHNILLFQEYLLRLYYFRIIFMRSLDNELTY